MNLKKTILALAFLFFFSLVGGLSNPSGLPFYGSVAFAGSFSAADLLNIENQVRDLARSILYLSPISYRPPQGFDYSDDFYRKTSSSAFVAEYRGRFFLLSAGHVLSGKTPGGKVVVFFEDRDAELPFMPFISEILDLAASDVTNIFPPSLKAGVLNIESSDLVKGRTPLVVYCNKKTFVAPVRIGFFDSITNRDGVAPTYLKVVFTGMGVEDGCSGSPVIDFQGKVRGLAVRMTLAGHALAIPSQTIALFLEEKFFKK